ncbi:O-antigen ligase family protein [Staphylococcus saprophyticus]|uniref:O-antigen ligase family protein n=1 Tax=Staphylococcus saprophyticus TaxID=29385 RepID=UPI0018882031|nr:O-antigen ligase family protein [Staphylococcus saprophyticus]MBF2780698.1 O-antigen ligase family protein [Staphylococcus saprophyticus]MDW4295906.1 O-antigen ligase family protein [Staphylococcus saprophyticus]
MLFTLWFLISIAFIVMLVFTIIKKRRKQSVKKFGIIAIILFVIGLILFITAMSQPAVDDSETEETKKVVEKSSQLDTRVDGIVNEIELNTISDVSSLAENGTITKKEARDINDEVGNKSDKVKKEIKKDREYKSLEKKEDKDELSDDELTDFLNPYLNKIQDLQQYL